MSATPPSPSATRRVSLEDLDKVLKAGEVQQLNLIIKGDASGSVEALESSLLQLDVGEEVDIRVLHRGVGAVTESDIDLATGSDAIVIGFNVRAEGRAAQMAEREGVDVRYYSVIYQAIEEIEAALKGMLKPEYEEVELGTAEIREVFRSSKLGNIAGVLIRSGEVKRNTKARLSATARSSRRTSTSRSAPLQGRRHRDPRRLRGRYQPRKLQRHQDRRRHRDVRDAREAARLIARRTRRRSGAGRRRIFRRSAPAVRVRFW